MKLKGTLLSSALLMLVLVTAVFYAQLLGHQLQQATYQRQSMYYRARTLAVLAQKLDLKPGQKASSAQGQKIKSKCFFQMAKNIPLIRSTRYHDLNF